MHTGYLGVLAGLQSRMLASSHTGLTHFRRPQGLHRGTASAPQRGPYRLSGDSRPFGGRPFRVRSGAANRDRLPSRRSTLILAKVPSQQSGKLSMEASQQVNLLCVFPIQGKCTF